ncbi:MAG: SBBP repeat-containing protein [Armatimonadota bacterium]
MNRKTTFPRMSVVPANTAICVLALFMPIACSAQSYDLTFSTYLGGSAQDSARGVAVDAEGNIYVTGGTTSPDFLTTEGAYDRSYTTGGQSVGAFGPMDVFVTKLDPNGKIVWSTFLGGPNYDRAYSVEVDSQGYVYVAGRAGEGFPTTPGVLQPEFAGDDSRNRAYGKQDGFITRLSPDGSTIVWSTYFGDAGGSIVRDIDIDATGNVYATLMGTRHPNPNVTPGAFQTTPAGDADNVIAKISADGSRVIWASYLGGSGRDLAPSIRVDATGHVLVDGSTASTDFPVTPGAFQRKSGGGGDAYVVKFRPDGSGLVYGTYLGGSRSDGAAGKHGLAVDATGHAYVVGFTESPDFPTTPGAFQRKYGGGMQGTWEQTGDRFVARLSPDGARLLAGTFVGGNARDGGEGVAVDERGSVYMSMFSYSSDFPVNADAMQPKRASRRDGTPFVLAPDFTRAVMSSYMGGSGEDNLRACALGSDGSFVVVGSTNSRDWPVRNAAQPSLAGDGDVVVVKFTPRR